MQELDCGSQFAATVDMFLMGRWRDGETALNKLAGTQRAPLHDSIVEKLRQMIISNELKPGERLSELDVGRAFGVSRTPLREALKLLAAEGLIEIRPHKGAIIAEISVQEISQTFDVIAALESMVGPLVCDRISNKDLAELESIVQQMDAQHQKRDLDSYFQLNKLFHNTIVSLTDNKVLSRTFSDMFDKVQRARYQVNDNYQRWHESSEEHHWILDALRARDAAEVGRRLKAHSARTAEAVIAQLSGSKD
jgi:DNA-binding GntR family transcriptional regulator